MPTRHQFEQADVALKSNFLTVQGKKLWADVLPYPGADKLTVESKELAEILRLGRLAILNGIEDMYKVTLAKNPGATVVRPSIFTVQLGTTAQTEGSDSMVYTPAGYANGSMALETPFEIQPDFYPFWNRIRAAGYMREVRGTSLAPDDGAWMLLRKPTLEEVASDWLGFRFTLPQDMPTLATQPAAQKARAYEDFKDEQRARVDMLDETLTATATVSERTRELARLKMGARIAALAFKQAAAYDKDDIEQDIDEAITYASDYSQGVVNAIENALF